MNTARALDTLAHDLRHAGRLLARNRSFAAVVVTTLALAIGANTAILSVAHAALVRPLPYAQPDRIDSVEVVIPERREQIPSLPPTVQTYLEWRKAPETSAMAALTPWEANLTGDGEPQRLGGARVSTNFFSFLGVAIAHGRGFTTDEETPGRDKVVVISDALWRARYGADPSVVGRAILVNGDRFVVVGIAPPSLLVPTRAQLHALLPFAPRIDIWKPIAPTTRDLRNESWDHGVLVRLGDIASRERGRELLASRLNEMIRVQAPAANTTIAIRLVPMRDVYAGAIRLRLLLVLAAASLLLLTACASIANVFLARIASRAGELATRVALGASRARILSQTLTETLLLAIAGGAIGTVLAVYGSRVLAAYGPEDLRPLVDARVTAVLLLSALAVSVATGVVCGIVPAWHAYRRDPSADLQEASRMAAGGRSAGRSRQALVGIEVALATLLLASAALLLRSFVNVMRTDRGYDVERVLAADLSLFGERYNSGGGRVAFYRGLLDRVRALPGVQAAGAINNLPAIAASEGASRTIFLTTDTDFQRVALARPVAMIRSVTTGYLAASGATLLAGRMVGDEEPMAAGAISESLARRLWPGDPLASIVGRQLRQGDVSGSPVTVVGVVGDARPGALDRDPAPAIYRPYTQWASGPMTLLVRTAQEPSTLANAIRAEVRAIDPNLPIAAMRTMAEIVSAGVAQRRFQMTLTSLFASVALLLATVGVYGVVSYAVACRTRDIGLRMALGAVPGDVMRWVFASGMRPVVAGLAAGLTAAILLARALRGLLFGVAPTDPLALGGVALVLLGAAALACYLPARRAASLDPMIALRHD